jgi:hypothetical protein
VLFPGAASALLAAAAFCASAADDTSPEPPGTKIKFAYICPADNAAYVCPADRT